jgi:enediyne biosynthesis protein E4
MAASSNRFRWATIAGLAVLAIVVAVVACTKSPTSTTAGGGPSVAPGDQVPDGPPLFEDVTPRTGIKFTYRNDEEADNYAIIESVGGGVALFDFDRDGRLDIFVPGGGRYDGKKVLGHPCKLYRNLGDWKFEDVTEKVGLTGDYPYTHGAAAFDYDNDGWTDLLLTGYNRLVLLHNEPDGKGGRKFVDVTQKAGLNDRLWSTSAAWGDLDGDGFPEIYVCHYGDWGFDTNHPLDCTYDGKTRDVCQPRKFKPLPHTLYKNNGNGTFTDVSEQALAKKLGHGLGVLFVDADGDGRPDIYVANDTDDKLLYMNRGKPGELKLEEVGLLAGVARDDRGWPNGSMGLDAGDFDRSGRPSLIVTNYENELPGLYQNHSAPGKERFTFATSVTGLATIGGSYVSWGTGFFDFDHDGWEDLLIVSGHAIRFPTKVDRRQKPALFRNTGGRFQIVTPHGGPYFREPHNARGAAFGDLDNDGKVDLVISHLNEPVVVLRNVAPTDGRHWVGFELVGEKNRDIVGARVVVEVGADKLTRFAKGGGGFASTNDRRLNFGLGSAAEIGTVTVYWPGGTTQQFKGLAVDRYWRLMQNAAEAETPTPAKQ